MALDAAVNHVKVRDTTEIDQYSNMMKVRVYTFYIGNHGPFTEKFYAGEQDTPAVERRINGDVLALREQGLLAPPQS